MGTGRRPGRPQEWDRSSIMDAALRWQAEHHGLPPSSGDWREWHPGYPTTQTVRNYFGSFTAMYEALEWPPNPPGPRVAFPQPAVVRSVA